MSRLFFPRPITSFHPFSAGSSPAGKIRLINKAAISPPRRVTTLMKWVGRHPLLLGSGLWLLLLAWNWLLAVAIATGTIGAIAVYLYQLRRLHVTWFNRFSQSAPFLSNQRLWEERVHQVSVRLRPKVAQFWDQCWRQVNRPLTIAILSGGAIASVVAMMVLLYRDVQSQSLVLAMGLQFLIVIGIGLGLWGQFKSDATSVLGAPTSEKGIKDEDGAVSPSLEDTIHIIDQLWADLISKDTSVRLIAIYRSVNWVQTLQNNPDPHLLKAMDATKLTACFRVMLSNEVNPSVQQALRDGLMSLQE